LFFRVCLQAMLVLVPPILCFSPPNVFLQGVRKPVSWEPFRRSVRPGMVAAELRCLVKTMDEFGLIRSGGARSFVRWKAWAIVGSLEKAVAVDVLLG